MKKPKRVVLKEDVLLIAFQWVKKCHIFGTQIGSTGVTDELNGKRVRLIAEVIE